MKLIKLLLLTITSFLVFITSCSPVLLSNESDLAKVDIGFEQATLANRQKSHATNLSSSSARYLFLDNKVASLTVESLNNEAREFAFTSQLDQETGITSFSLSISLFPGIYTFTVRTFDENGFLLSQGSTTKKIKLDFANTIAIKLLPLQSFTTGELISIESLQTMYIYLSHSQSGYADVFTQGALVWECAADGSFSGPGISNGAGLLFAENEVKLIRVRNTGEQGLFAFAKRNWQYLGDLTNTITTTTITPSPSGWEYITAMDNKIYFATPDNFSAFPATFVAYDLSTKSLTNLNYSGSYLTATGQDSNLIAANGKLYYFANLATVYNPFGNVWSNLSVSPLPRGEPGTAVLGDKIYLFSGRDDTVGNFYIYDTSNDDWSTGGTATFSNHATSWSTVAVYGTDLYVFGGQEAPQKFSVYNTVTDTWTAQDDIPYVNFDGRPQAFTINSKILVLTQNAIYTFDPVQNIWLEPINITLGSSLYTTFNNKLYAVSWDYESKVYKLYEYLP